MNLPEFTGVYFVVHLDSGLVVRCEAYASALAYVSECGGVVLKDGSFAQEIVSKCRKMWNR